MLSLYFRERQPQRPHKTLAARSCLVWSVLKSSSSFEHFFSCLKSLEGQLRKLRNRWCTTACRPSSGFAFAHSPRLRQAGGPHFLSLVRTRTRMTLCTSGLCLTDPTDCWRFLGTEYVQLTIPLRIHPAIFKQHLVDIESHRSVRPQRARASPARRTPRDCKAGKDPKNDPVNRSLGPMHERAQTVV